MNKIINSKKAPKAIGPYNQAILANNTLYCSGQIAINPKNNELVTENIQKETIQVINNIIEILKEANMDLSNVVKCTIYMKNMDQYDEINNIYSQFFRDKAPAREAIEVSKLPKNANIEISVIAINQ